MKKQKISYIIKVRPDQEILKNIPKQLREKLEKSGKVQSRSFDIVIKLLSIGDYKKYYHNKYSFKTIVHIFNNYVEPIDVDMKYIIRFSMLVKGIIDLIFSVSGNEIEEINSDPEKLFKALEQKRTQLRKIDSLMDNLVARNTSLETYLKYMQMEDLEDRMTFVAMIEELTGVVLKERYEFSKKTNTPIRLTPADRYYQREFQNVMSNNGNVIDPSLFAETTRVLTEKMSQDKKYAEMGIKKAVNTSAENAELMNLDK